MYSLFSSPAKLKAGVRRSERGVCDRVSFLHVQELVHTGAGGYLRSDVPRGEIRARERERERERGRDRDRDRDRDDVTGKKADG